MADMLSRVGAFVLAVAALSPAALVRIEVEERSDVLDGKAFGRSGAYERIIGKAYFAVDPSLRANQQVVDLDKAPRNAAGLVEFSADLYVLKPRNPATGNGALLYEVSNRGGKSILATFNRAAGSPDPRLASHFGDGFLLEQGYTLVWLGWQFDVPKGMRLSTPIVKGVQGPVRAEIILNQKATEHSLGDRNHLPYPVLNPQDPALTLTVRDRANGPRQTVPRSQWSLADNTKIVIPGGFEPGRIYELVYTAQDSPVAGLGPAAVRDMLAFLKYGGGSATTILGDSRRYIKRAYGFGSSQSGRFLRTFVHDGFNRDEKDRKVFDGMIPHVAGGGRGSFNIRFAQASRDGHPFLNTFYPTDIFPFADLPQTDAETGLTGGILSRTPPEAAPKIFYTNSAYEYYGRAASLIHTSIDGREDAPLAPGTRIYFFAGSQHGPAGFPPRRSEARNLPNPNPFTLSLRALLVALDNWVRDGKEPPPSQYPQLAARQLVAVDRLDFPRIPGVALPTRIQTGYRVDYGPQFRTAGIVSIEPPKVGNAFPAMVPQVDADGNETSGVRLPSVQVPLATLTGWNLRTEAIGAADELYSMVGSYLPFPRTKAERAAAGDPRASIEERYATRAEYLEKVGAWARTLAERGYLLDRDVALAVERAAAEWDWVQGGTR